jgi:hypothetical protein
MKTSVPVNRWFLFLFIDALLLLSTALAHASDALRVDGVSVSGRIRDVERIDIREAIKVGASHGSVFKAEVLGPSDIKVYLRNLGFIQLGRYAGIQSDGTRSHDWSWSYPSMYDPEVLQLIRTADEVSVFSVTTPLKPHRDDKHMRLLSGDARRQIIRLLGNEKNWCHCVFDLVFVEPEPTNVGLLFRRGRNELMLFFTRGGYAEGTFNGHYIANPLNEGKRMDDWSSRFAQTELAVK